MKESHRKKLFSPQERLRIMELIIKKLQDDKRIAGVIQIGSSAYGFIDQYSDLDFAIVVYDNEDLMAIYKDWREIMFNLLPIIHNFEHSYSPTSLLHGFFLDNYLEIDMGFQPISNISAKREHWKIAFDKTGKLNGIMNETWIERQEKISLDRFVEEVNASWYYINRVLVALARENYWRALFEIENIRNMIVFVVGQRTKHKIDRFQEINELPEDILLELKNLLVSSLEKRILFENLKKATSILYREVIITSNKLNGPEFKFLEKNMLNLIRIYEDIIFKR